MVAVKAVDALKADPDAIGCLAPCYWATDRGLF
jgi:hypothetical protein